MDTAHRNNVGATFRSPVVRLAGGLKPAPTLIVLFFFLLPWQTRWIIAPGASEYATISMTVVEVIFWLLIVATVIASKRSAPKAHPPLADNLIWIFLAFATLSLFWTSDRTAGTVALVHLVEGALLFIILRSDDKLRQLSVRAFLYGMLPAAALGIYQFLTQHIAGSTLFGIAPHDAWMAGASVVETSVGRTLRAYGPFPHPNIFGGYLVVTLLFVVTMLLRQGGQKTHGREKIDPPRWVLFAVGPVFATALIATFSRSAWAALAVGLTAFALSIVWAAFRPPVDRGQAKASPYIGFAFLVVSIVIPFVLAFAFAPDLFRARLSATGRLEARSTIERTTSLRAGVEAVRQSPLIGHGLGGFSSLRAQRSNPVYEPPHNFFLALAADLGLVGLLLFFLSLRGVRRRSNLIRLPIVAALITLALFDHYLWTLLPGIWLLWFALGFASVFARTNPKGEDEAIQAKSDPSP